MNSKYFIIAGESSGDLHGSHLMHEMQTLNPKINFQGIGGNLMVQKGLKSIVDINEMNVMGFIEVVKKYSFFKSIQKKSLEIIEEESFDGIILIDYPGFNLRLAKKIKEKNPKTPIHYYISPQVWAWKEERLKIIKDCVDQMVVIFEFEQKWYLKRGVTTKFVGHPFLDIYKNFEKDKVKLELGLDINKKHIALFPGSRIQEIQKHLPIMLRALNDDFFRDFVFLIGQARDLDTKSLSKFDLSRVRIIKDSPEKALASSDFAWVGSGTSTLQSVMFNTPFILLYKTSCLSWLLMKHFVKVKYAGMPNIILNEELIPELLQKNLTSEKIINETKRFFNDNNYKKRLMDGYKKIINELGRPGASLRAAKNILEYSKN
jgi:lipid-A-disaccharide synthase